MTVFREELLARERIARAYDQRLGNAVVIPARVPDSTSVWAIYSILLPEGISRDAVQARLKEQGVPTAIYYPRPLHLQPAYRDHHDGSPLPVSESLAHRILALPIHPDLSEAQVDHIAAAVRAAVA